MHSGSHATAWRTPGHSAEGGSPPSMPRAEHPFVKLKQPKLALRCRGRRVCAIKETPKSSKGTTKVRRAACQGARGACIRGQPSWLSGAGKGPGVWSSCF